MNKLKGHKNSLRVAMICAVIVTACLFIGCAETGHLKTGHTVRLENVTVHFMGPEENFINDPGNVIGQAWRPGLILMPGTVVDGKITYDMNILGHELGHLLNWEDGIVTDPHNLK